MSRNGQQAGSMRVLLNCLQSRKEEFLIIEINSLYFHFYPEYGGFVFMTCLSSGNTVLIYSCVSTTIFKPFIVRKLDCLVWRGLKCYGSPLGRCALLSFLSMF